MIYNDISYPALNPSRIIDPSRKTLRHIFDNLKKKKNERKERNFRENQWQSSSYKPQHPTIPLFALTKGQRSKRQLSKYFTVVFQPLSTRFIKPNCCFLLSHRRSTTAPLETSNPFTTQPLRPRSFLGTTTLKLTMPNLKTLTKELRQEIVSYLYPLPSISSNLAFRLAIHIFTKN